MEIWRSSNKDSLGLLIIAFMLSSCLAFIVLMMLISCNSGKRKPSNHNSKQKKSIDIFNMWKFRTESKKTPRYKEKRKITRQENVNEQKDTAIKFIEANADSN